MISTLIALALLSSLSAYVLIGPRVYYAMAKNKAFFAGAAKVDPRWHTPVNAIGKNSNRLFFFPKFALSLTFFGPSAALVESSKSGALSPTFSAMMFSCVWLMKMVDDTGLEPVTSSMSRKRSSQLS